MPYLFLKLFFATIQTNVCMNGCMKQCMIVCVYEWLYDRVRIIREHPGTSQCADLCVTWWIACSYIHLTILHTIHKTLTQKPCIN